MTESSDWSSRDFSSEGKQNSVDDMRRRRAEQWIQDDLTRSECNCRHPVAGSKYLGRTSCSVCRRMFPKEPDAKP